MAGYIMTLSNFDSLKECINTGIYSTNLSEPNGRWIMQHEGTFADYLSMKEGDSIYFFIQRKIYGIGRIKNTGFDCKYLNYIEADVPKKYSVKEYKERQPLLPSGIANNRCFCTFKPSPFFFMDGVDMDDALNSNPTKFKMLRVMWKVSFIKVDDEENQALIDIILKRNEDKLVSKEGIYNFDERYHADIINKVTKKHRISANNILLACANESKINHEMAIEAVLCELLVKENNSIFGKWDYVSRQVVASPFKAVDYMDKMDVFGYKLIPGYSTKSKYLVIEIKKDKADDSVIEQIMKYVDWINSEYTHGDYSMIEAYVVAEDYTDNVIKRREKDCVRNFTKGYRPAKPCCWNNVKLITYKYNKEEGKLNFIEK